MSRPDATASAALAARVIRPVFFVYLDIVGDPVRACTAGRSVTPTGTGDPDLDGFAFGGIDAKVVDIGPVKHREGGADTVTAKLSGLLELDAGLLAIVGDAANWQGRVGRLWRMVRDADGVQRGAIQHYWTGWMSALSIGGDPAGGQTIDLSIESYLAAYSAPSNRSYLDQEQFDPGDLSARATIAIANGTSGNPLLAATPTSAGAGSWGGGGLNVWKAMEP